MESRDSFCFPKNTKNPNPSPIEKKFGFCCGAPPGTRTLGPLIKRNQCATIVSIQNCVNLMLLSFYREFAFYICCILCIRYPLLHPLSSRSGVQKVCKNVQSQNQPLKTGIEFLCKAGKTAGFEPETAATILSVQTKHQMYINNYDSQQGAQDKKVHPMQFSMHPMNFFSVAFPFKPPWSFADTPMLPIQRAERS